jgi:hypothetical protein
VLTCSTTELQDAASRIPTSSGSTRKVYSTSKCIRVLNAWGYLDRTASRTSVSLLDDAEGSLAQHSRSMDPGEEELRLPSGMRANTHQARAWLAVARNVGLRGALEAQATRAGGEGEARRELVQRDVETSTFDTWARDCGLDQTQFANALRALQTKGLLSVERSPTVQIRVPGSVRDETGDVLPGKADERVQELVEKRQLRWDRLKAMEECMVCPVDRSLGEDETLWRLIMRYFGEEPCVELHRTVGVEGSMVHGSTIDPHDGRC